MSELVQYKVLLTDIKNRVRKGQLRVNLSANAEMLSTYWDIGRMIHERQNEEGWGAGVIPRLAKDLKNELSEVKGFSERNLNRMMTFFKEYYVLGNQVDSILPTPLAKLENEDHGHFSSLKTKKEIMQLSVANLSLSENCGSLILLTSWSRHILLIDKIKDVKIRYWYMQQNIIHGWSYNTLSAQIKSNLYERQGNSATNFEHTLPPAQSALAKEMLKDPYIFDFATLTTEFTERELELELVKYLEKFLVELGAGFAG